MGLNNYLETWLFLVNFRLCVSVSNNVKHFRTYFENDAKKRKGGLDFCIFLVRPSIDYLMLGYTISRVNYYTAKQLCTQPCNIHTHSHPHLPGYVLIIVYWLGFACGRFFPDTIWNRHAEAKFTIAHVASRKSVSLNRTITLQFEGSLPGCVPPTGLCVSVTAVCNFAGLRAWFIAIEHESILTKIYVTIWGHLGRMGFNQWAQSKALDVIIALPVTLPTVGLETGEWAPPGRCSALPGLYLWKTRFVRLYF